METSRIMLPVMRDGERTEAETLQAQTLSRVLLRLRLRSYTLSSYIVVWARATDLFAFVQEEFEWLPPDRLLAELVSMGALAPADGFWGEFGRAFPTTYAAAAPNIKPSTTVPMFLHGDDAPGRGEARNGCL